MQLLRLAPGEARSCRPFVDPYVAMTATPNNGSTAHAVVPMVPVWANSVDEYKDDTVILSIFHPL
jgi:hypothetical protein